MHPARKALIFIGILAALAGLGWLLWAGPPAEAVEIPPHKDPSGIATRESRPKASETDRITYEKPGECMTILVRNAQGKPVSGAEPRIMSRPSGELKVMDHGAFADPSRRGSSSDGMLRLSLDLLRSSSDRLERIFLVHHDYVPAAVSLLPSRRDYVVILARGKTLRIKAVLEDGTPLENIGFRVVPSQPSLSFMTVSQSSGFFVDPSDMETSQVIGRTGADGWLEIRNLRARRYLVAPMDTANAYIPSRTQEMVVAQPPFEEITFTFAIPLALLESVADDRVRGGMTRDP